MKTWTFQPAIIPPGARGTFRNEMLDDASGYVAEWKYDGDRRVGQVVSEGIARYTGRLFATVNKVKTDKLVEKTDRVPHLAGTAYVPPLPPARHPQVPFHRVPPELIGTVLDGEFTCPWKGARSKDVTSIVGSDVPKAIAKQIERGWLRWRVFDCLFWKGIDVRSRPLEERRVLVEEAVAVWDNPFITVAEQVHVSKQAFLESVWAEEGEGIILKRLGSVYGDEQAWVKIKKEFTQDAVIMGFDPPKALSEKVTGEVSATKYAERGWIGAIRFGQYKDGVLTECGSCSGMPDDLRADISANPSKHLGRVIEILANEREPTGRFRHPRFVQFRDDKEPSDCIWDQK